MKTNNQKNNRRKTQRFLAVLLVWMLVLSTASSMTFAAEDSVVGEEQIQITPVEETGAEDTQSMVESAADENKDAGEVIEQENDDSLHSETDAVEAQSYPEEDVGVTVMAAEASRVQNTKEDMKAASDRTNAQLGISSVGRKLDKTYRTILITGTDNGSRADMLIILSINRSNGKGKIFTVTRDTYMQLDCGRKHVIDDKARAFCKCNRAYEVGNRYTLMKELNRHLDLNIREFIGVDWDCAANLVNKLNSMGFQIKGNITSKSMLKAINRLSPKEANLKSTGSVKLKGWQAVQYLRVRKYDGGSPLVRESRNRAMFRQIFGIGKKMTLKQATEVFDYIYKDLDTNMTEDKLRSAIALIATADLKDAKIQIREIKEVKGANSFPNKSVILWDPDGHFTYVVPASLKSNTTIIHKKIYGSSKYAPGKSAKSLNSTIEKHRKKVLKKKRATLASAKIKSKGSTYNGKKQVPKLTVTLGGRKLKKGRDYKIGSLKNNKNVGIGTFKIKGTGTEYKGTKKGNFRINPKGTNLLKVTASKGGFKTVWKVNSSKMSKKRIEGYQIQYSANSGFKKGKKIRTVKGYKSKAVAVTKLRSNCNYFVRIRTYMKIGKKTYYSPWSKKAEIVTK